MPNVARKTLLHRGHLSALLISSIRERSFEQARLGYRMTSQFAATYFGQDFPAFTFRFTDEILRPEFQDLEVFVESVGNIAVTHERIARSYFDDGTIALACPPLKCLLDIMAYGKTTEGNGLDAPAVRGMFSRESVLSSKWYAARLDAKRRIDSDRLNRAVAGLSDFIEVPDNDRVVKRLGLLSRLEQAKNSLENIASMQYCDGLVGTLGVQDLLR